MTFWNRKSTLAPQLHEVWETDGRRVGITKDEADRGVADGTLRLDGHHSRAPVDDGMPTLVYRYVRA